MFEVSFMQLISCPFSIFCFFKEIYDMENPNSKALIPTKRILVVKTTENDSIICLLCVKNKSAFKVMQYCKALFESCCSEPSTWLLFWGILNFNIFSLTIIFHLYRTPPKKPKLEFGTSIGVTRHGI